jgi:hypothetical protein
MITAIRFGVAALGGLALAGGMLLPAAPAGAATLACTKAASAPHCVGLESNQPLRLELAATGGAGSFIVADRPAFSRSQDWYRPGADNGASRIEWAPRGVRSGLCMTETSDVKRSMVRLEPCVSGVAGSSHQMWRHHDNGPNYNFTNEATGLALAVAFDTPGAPLQVRSPHFGSGNQIFSCIGHSSSQTGP